MHENPCRPFSHTLSYLTKKVESLYMNAREPSAMTPGERYQYRHKAQVAAGKSRHVAAMTTARRKADPRILLFAMFAEYEKDRSGGKKQPTERNQAP